jgi:hypothetical protein
MKKKEVLMGMFGVLLIFGMIVIGCDNGSTDDPWVEPTAAEKAAALAAALVAQFELEVDDVTVDGATIALNAGAELTIAAETTLAVPSGVTFDLSALYTGEEDDDTTVELAGAITVASGGTLRLSQGDGTGAIPEIAYSGTGSLTIAKGGGIVLADGDDDGSDDDVYIGTGGLYEWGNSSSGSITLSSGKMELEGKIKAANP